MLKGTSKNLSFDHLILYPSPKGEGQAEFLEVPLIVRMWSNFHTHSQYCDGKGALKDYLEAGKKSVLSSIGFSSHAPIPITCKWCMKKEALPLYLQEIESLKTSYQDIEIYKGLEIDFIPGIISPEDYKSVLDYTLGSIHFVDGFEGRAWEIDGSHQGFKEGLNKIFQNNIRYELNIPITLSSDAHHPDDLINQFQQTASLLKDIGFKTLSDLRGGLWRQMLFNQDGIIL